MAPIKYSWCGSVSSCSQKGEGASGQPLLKMWILIYRVSSKTVPTWLFALLSASTHANYKSWDVFEKFKKFATR